LHCVTADSCGHSRVAVLFSGGIDSLVLAALADRSDNLHHRNFCFCCEISEYVAVGPDQIALVAADNRSRANHWFIFRAIGASSSGLCSSFAARTGGDWNQLPAVVVEQESLQKSA